MVRRLGGGTRYEVYLAWEERMLSLVVAKVLRPDRARRERSLRALEREAALLDQLAHPVLLRGFGADVEGPRPHLLLEHLEGPTLHSLLRHGPVSAEQIAPAAVQLAGALHYLGGEGVAHLDIKPDNVLLDTSPRIIDLSLARDLADARALRKPVGTRSYMAPEQCEPGLRGEPGPPSDVWGLGATLYHALSGRRPFAEETGEASTAAAKTVGGVQDAHPPVPLHPQLDREPLPLPSYVPDGLAEPILACLRQDPAERPMARDLASALEPCSAGLARRVKVGRRGAYLR